ncbi:MAG: element excision factor XisI family protein [Nostoc sp.]
MIDVVRCATRQHTLPILEQYREDIQNLLTKYGSYQPLEEDVEIQLIFDTARDHYQILEIGWDGYDRIYNCVIHLDIKDEKIWIQHNMTDIQIAEDLAEMGVPREDMILGLQPSYLRQYTQYGVA